MDTKCHPGDPEDHKNIYNKREFLTLSAGQY